MNQAGAVQQTDDCPPRLDSRGDPPIYPRGLAVETVNAEHCPHRSTVVESLERSADGWWADTQCAVRHAQTKAEEAVSQTVAWTAVLPSAG